MKDNLSVAIAVFAVLFAGVRLYQKYYGKDRKPQPGDQPGGNARGANKKEEDYEPYSGR